MNLPSCKSSTATSWKSCSSTRSSLRFVPCSSSVTSLLSKHIMNCQADMARCDQSSLLRVGQSCHHSITSAEQPSQYVSLPWHYLVTTCPHDMHHCILRLSQTLEASEVANNGNSVHVAAHPTASSGTSTTCGCRLPLCGEHHLDHTWTWRCGRRAAHSAHAHGQWRLMCNPLSSASRGLAALGPTFFCHPLPYPPLPGSWERC